MQKILSFPASLVCISWVLSACTPITTSSGAVQQAPTARSAPPLTTASAQAQPTAASTPRATQGEGPGAGLSLMELAVGILKLDGTANTVSKQEAAQLLPLWIALGDMEQEFMPQLDPPGTGTGSNGGPSPAEMDAEMKMIEATMTAEAPKIDAQTQKIRAQMTTEQLQAISDMRLADQNWTDVMTELGIGAADLTAETGRLPTDVTPPPGATPIAGPGEMTFQVDAGPQFIPPELISRVTQYLQQKADSR